MGNCWKGTSEAKLSAAERDVIELSGLAEEEIKIYDVQLSSPEKTIRTYELGSVRFCLSLVPLNLLFVTSAERERDVGVNSWLRGQRSSVLSDVQRAAAAFPRDPD